jgi:hypothetical protein
MPSITVAMINSDCLNLKYFPVQQQEIELAIEGDTDPNTLQKLRDHISASVQHHRGVINKFIKDKAEEISKQKAKKQAEELTKKYSAELEKVLRSAAPKVQASASKFFLANNAIAAQIQLGTYKYTVKVLWTPVTMYLGLKLFGAGVATGGAGWVLAAKFWVDTIKDVGLWGKGIYDAYAAARVDLKQLQTAIDTIRKIKPPKKIENTHIDTLKIKAKAYSARILGFEMEAKEAAKHLDNLLNQQEKVKDAPKEAADKMAEIVKAQIKMVKNVNKMVEEGKRKVTSANDHATNAEKRAKNEWTTWLPALGKLYDFLSAGVDISQDLKNHYENAFTAAKYIGGIVVDKTTED